MSKLSVFWLMLLLVSVGCGQIEGGPDEEAGSLSDGSLADAVRTRDAFGVIGATRFNAQSGIRTKRYYISSLDGGDWVRYNQIDFGDGANLWRAKVSVPAAYAGQQIELHLDAISSPAVGTLTVASTGGWTTFVEQATAIAPTTGIHDLFLKVVGSAGAANLASFTFDVDPSLLLRDAFKPIDGVAFDAQSGITNFGGYVGSLDNGDWIRYNGINFAGGATVWRAMVSVPAIYAGQNIELHLDDLASPAVGMLTVAATGDWTTFVEQSATITTTTGVHDLYLTVVGAFGAANISQFTFGNGDVTPPPSVPPPTTPPPPTGTCSLTPSGPVTATADGQVIEGLAITSSGDQAILVDGYSGVTIRNVRILHSAGFGIRLNYAPGTVIENVSVEFTDAPASGANASQEFVNIYTYQSHDLTVHNVRLTRGSAGINLVQSDRSHLSVIEGHDFRGPFPRGQLMQWNTCNTGVLEDFSVQGDLDTTWTEDNVNAYRSTDIVVRRGLIDGNNAPAGVGVIADAGTSNMLVEDVDALHQGNGCFAAYTNPPDDPPSDNVHFRRVRCKDTHCGGVAGRSAPQSGGVIIANYPENTNISIESSSYFNHCSAEVVWDATNIWPLQLANQDFTPRAATHATLCWE